MSPAQSPLANDLAEEREALEDLLQSKGWRILESHIAEEWQGIGYYSRMNSVLESTAPEEARVIHRCSKEIVKAFTWPKRRVIELSEAK